MNFNKDVIKASMKEPIVVQFSGATCPPCVLLKPILTTLSIERRDFKFVVVDAWENMKLSKEYGIRAVPHTILFHNGQIISEKRGFSSKASIEAWLDENLATLVNN